MKIKLIFKKNYAAWHWNTDTNAEGIGAETKWETMD